MTTNLSPVECRPFPTFLKDAMTPSPLQCHNTTNFQHLDVPSGYGQPLGEEWSGWEEFDERSVQPDGDVYRNGGVEQDNDEDIGEGGESGREMVQEESGKKGNEKRKLDTAESTEEGAGEERCTGAVRTGTKKKKRSGKKQTGKGKGDF